MCLNIFRDTNYFENDSELDKCMMVVEDTATVVNKCSLTVHILTGTEQFWIKMCQAHYQMNFQELIPGQQQMGSILRTDFKTLDGEKYGSLVLTIYPHKSKLHVQGRSHQLWGQEHLPFLALKVVEIMKTDGRAIPQRKPRQRHKTRVTPAVTMTKGKFCAVCSSIVTEDVDPFKCDYCTNVYHTDS